MPIQFTCPHCGHQTFVDDQYAGQSGPCSACGQTVTVPAQGYTGPAPVPRGSSSGSMTVVIVLVVVGAVLFLCCGGGVALMLPAVQSARESARRMQCTNNIKQLAIGVHNYHDTYNAMPPAIMPRENEEGESVPHRSWRVTLLPYLEQQGMYEQFNQDEPWDSDHNLQIASMYMPETFQCPSQEPTYKMVNGYRIPCANYVMIRNGEIDPKRGAIGGDTEYKDRVQMRDIMDGTSNTLLIVEVKGDNCPAWTEPVDLTLDDLANGVNAEGVMSIGSNHPGGANVGLADGSVRFMPETIDQSTLDALGTRNGAETVTDF